MIDLLLRNARIGDEQPLIDIAINGDKIHALGPMMNVSHRRAVDLAGAVVVPGLVDAHQHIDKACTRGSAAGAHGLHEAIAQMQAFRQGFREDEAYRRGARLLETLMRHGVCAVRSHCDIDATLGTRGIEVLLALKKAYADRIELQVVAFPNVHEVAPEDPVGEAVLRRALSMGCEVIGGAPHMSSDPQRHIDAVLRLASEFDCLVDLHVDETDDPDHIPTLPYIAEATLREKLQERVTCSHCSALSLLPDTQAERVIEQAREAVLHIVVCPLTNLYLQGGAGRVPTHRGLTRVRELMDRGVNVVFGSDNVRDAFNPYGNADPLLAAMMGGVAARLGAPAHLQKLLCGVTHGAAAAMRLPAYGLAAGCRADLVALECERPSDAVPSLASRRLVVLQGRIAGHEASRPAIGATAY